MATTEVRFHFHLGNEAVALVEARDEKRGIVTDSTLLVLKDGAALASIFPRGR